MNKPVVFVSHINEESQVAVALKKLIEDSFLGMIDFFVSSDDSSIEMGQRWLDRVTDALRTCSIEIVVCSPFSIQRPWINFEAGAGWVRDIPVVPLCHSGMTPSNLPVPLNMLQAAAATEVSSLKLVLPVLAHAIGSTVPSVDFTGFIEEVKQFEDEYLFWGRCGSAFNKLSTLHKDLISSLRRLTPVTIELTEIQINSVKVDMDFLAKSNILALVQLPGFRVSGAGTTLPIQFTPLPKLKQTLESPKLRL